MTILFARDIKTIGKHINNVFQEGELERKSTVAKFATVQNEGGRFVEREIEYYNLDVIISVGYRVKSFRGTLTLTCAGCFWPSFSFKTRAKYGALRALVNARLFFSSS